LLYDGSGSQEQSAGLFKVRQQHYSQSRRDGAIKLILHYTFFLSPYRRSDCDHRFFRFRFSQTENLPAPHGASRDH
jgi:hypothetical protein